MMACLIVSSLLLPVHVWTREISARTQEVSARELFIGVSTATVQPLGLRYSLLRDDGSGRFREVPTDTVFRTGDRIRLRAETNAAGYVYVVHEGSDGNWSVLFPASNVNGSRNTVRKNEPQDVPAGGAFRFTDPSGTERVIVVVSREPIGDLERLIYTFRGNRAAPGDTGAPANSPADPNDAQFLIAENVAIGNSLIGNLLNTVQTRNLVFETVSNDTPERLEHAQYIVNVAGGSDTRIVADIRLTHE
jgi:hypothetical protein